MLRYLARSIIIYIALSSTGFSQGAGQPYFEKGYQAYMRNQFPPAEFFFKKAYRKATTSEDKAFILKYLGITQFMKGNKKGSSQAFNNALKLDPTLRIDSEEVLDASVIVFFQEVKISFLQRYKPNNKDLSQVSPDKKKKRKKRKKKNKNRSEKGSDDSWFNIAHLAPFGVPQLYNGQYLLGAFYGGGQVVSAALYIQRLAQISTEKSESASVAADASIADEQKNDFLEKNSDYIGTLESDADTAIISFGLLYTASVIHGMVSAEPAVKRKSEASMRQGGQGKNMYSLISPKYEPSTDLSILPYKSGLAFVINYRY